MNYLDIDGQTGKLITDKEVILQSIKEILFTPLGSRVMRRDFGSMLFELIDQPNNAALRLRIIAAVVIALNQFEPRINVIKVTITEQEEKLTLAAVFELKDGASNQELALISLN